MRRRLQRVAVTGGSGFIGQRVLALLAKQPVEVIAVTRDAERLQALSQSAMHIVEFDISTADSTCFDRLGRPDLLIHLAWDGLPNYKALHHIESELPLQYAFLKNMVENGLNSLFVAGTCFEYGLQSGSLSEELEPRPVTPYGYAKNALRCQLAFLRETSPFAMTWGRMFYMYGEGQPRNCLYSLVHEALTRGRAAFAMSGGEQLRDYLPVGDVARIIVGLALHRPDSGTVNVCSGSPISIRRLVEGWISEYGRSIKLELGKYPYPDHEPLAFWGDTRKLSRLLEGLNAVKERVSI